MRILTVCTSTHVFGAEIITLKMLEGLKEAGHEQLAITSTWTDGEFNRRLSNLGIPEIRMPFGALSARLGFRPMWWTANVLVRLPLLWTQWARAVKKFQPDIVILTSWRQSLAIYPWLSRQSAFQVEHSNLEPTKQRRLLYSQLARRITGFIAVSEFTGKHLHCLGVPRPQIHVVVNGPISAADREKTSSQSHSPFASDTGNPRVGIVGQIAPAKGHHILLEAVRLLRDRNLSVEVRIFGSGEPKYISELSSKMSEYRLSESWRWMGYLTDPRKIYSDMDICVVPSLCDEAFGMVAVEAGAFGVPVIATNSGGLAEIVEDGITGLLFSSGDSVHLADKIHALVNDPDCARRIGSLARAHVCRKFTQEKMIADFERLFRAVLENKGKV